MDCQMQFNWTLVVHKIRCGKVTDFIWKNTAILIFFCPDYCITHLNTGLGGLMRIGVVKQSRVSILMIQRRSIRVQILVSY